MYRTESTEYQYFPFIVSELEDIPGGGVVALDDLKDAVTPVAPGAVVGEDSNGLWHLCKVATLYADAANDATTYQVEKGHQFVVGDIITSKDVSSCLGYAITDIDTTTNTTHDVITVGTSLGVAMTAANDVYLVQIAAQDAVGGAGVLKYTPRAFTKTELDASKANEACGLLKRGTVKEALLAFPVPDCFKTALTSRVDFV